MYQKRSLPVFTRLHHKLTDRWRTRESLEFERSFRYDADAQELEIRFFVERTPISIDLWAATGEPIYVDRFSCVKDDELEPVDFGVETSPGDGEQRLLITPGRRFPTTRALLHFKDPFPEVGSRMIVRIASAFQDDLQAVNEAHAQAQAGRFPSAIESLEQYAEAWKENPTISYWLSGWYQQQGDQLDAAEQYAVRAALHGSIEVCAERYREVQGERYPRTIKQIRSLQDQARQWSIGDHHGIVVVETSQQFTLGLNNAHLTKCRNLIEIRRPAAARMLSELSFPFSTASEYVLYTRMRIIHGDDSIEELPIEHFTVSDQEGKNIFITVDDEKVGHWILPDLVPGDLIDWAYHLLCWDHGTDGTPNTLILTGLFDAWFPTFRGRVEFSAPGGELSERFTVRNSYCVELRGEADGMETIVFVDEKFIPARRTGFEFENNYLNPRVICTSDGNSWSDLIPGFLSQIHGKTPGEDELPEPLAAIVDGNDDKESSLEHAFYWIRDTLKYATTRSGVKNIGQKDRARRIIESGVGNCNDKSYLLSLVCRRLNLPCEFVAISRKNGVLIEEAPADQFDHVFVRVKTVDQWIYLDAVGSMSTFGSAPAWCQGMLALALDDEGTVITIPVDPPDVNSIEISESFQEIGAGRIHGRFSFCAYGQCARLIDERWKQFSLTMDDHRQSGQEALREFLPSSAVLNYARDVETSGFHVSGQHSRGPLVPLGKNGRVIGTLLWDVPFLPVSYWRTLQLNQLRVRTLDNPVCTIGEEVEDDGSALTVRRTIVVKNKYTRGEEVKLVPEALERIDEALQLVISIDGVA